MIRVAFLGRSAIVDQHTVVRQVWACQRGLPVNAVIVAFFYDIGSGRIDPAQRGPGNADELAQIPVPRDGGIADLLGEAEHPDRRFDMVICASIDRISRSTHIALGIEERLHRSGVGLLVANEPIELSV